MTETFRLPNYPTFHCHPQSFDSASTPEAFAAREVELGSGALTCTDHGSMGATRQIYDLARKNKLIPILGIEGYFRDDNCSIIKSHGIEDPSDYLKYMHITVHAKTQKAFEVLSRKISTARLESGHGSQTKPLWDWKDLEEILAEDVTVGSGCLVGMVSRHLLRDGLDPTERYSIASAYYDRLRGMARPGNFYAELFPHKCDTNWTSGIFLTTETGERNRYWDRKNLKFEKYGEVYAEDLVRVFKTKRWHEGDRLVEVKMNRKWTPIDPVVVLNAERIEGFLKNECAPWCPDGDVQLTANRVVHQLCKKYGDKVALSDDSHFATPDEKVVQDVRLKSMGNWRFASSYHRRSSDETFAHFQSTMGVDEKTFLGWIDNAKEWVDGFKDFKFDSPISLPTKFYPTDTLGHTKKLIDQVGRMDWSNQTYVDRLKKEIQLFHANGTIDLLPYFFMGAEVVELYEKNGSLTGPGRGCFVPNSPVVLESGETKAIEKIKTGDRVISHDGSFQSVTHVLAYDVDEELVEIKVDDGRSFCCTKDHEILTSRGWVPAGLLSVEDEVVDLKPRP